MTRSVLLVVALLVALAGCRGTGEPVVDEGGLDATASPVETEDGDDGEPEEEPSPTSAPSPSEEASATPAPPTFAEVCEGRDDEAFIEVLTPQPGAVVSDPITVTGCGNTFEANFQYRLEAADGTVLVEDFGTMSCGNGCVGEFSVTLEAGTTGEVLLTVFESSAQDGSPQHVNLVTLTVE